MVLRIEWSILLLVGCGDVMGPPGTKPDAALPTPDADMQPDAAPGVWSTPTRIDALSVAGMHDSGATLRADGCEVYFTSNRPDGGSTDIWKSSRFTINDPWGAPSYVGELDAQSTTESGPDLSADGKEILFARAVASGTTGYDIYIARRNSPTEAWGTPTLVSELNTTGHERSPHLSADSLTIWFSRHNGTDYDIWTATRSSPTGTWSNLREVQRLTSTADDESVTTTGDGLVMYFETARDGAMTIYTATRLPGDPWNAPTAVPELAGFERPDVLPDGKYMVLTKPAADGYYDLYESHLQ